MVAAWPWGAYLGEEGLKRGIRVKISSYTRHHVNITMTQAKAVSNYTNSILANMEATDEGYDEAMLLDPAASSAKARARTSSSSRRAWSTRPTCRPAP
jgi:branched-chain amino acid aminotransferase